MINIYLTKFEKPLTSELWELNYSLLPPDLKDRNVRFIRWQDRHSHLFGKLLLLEGLKGFNINYNVLQSLQLNSYERPFCPIQKPREIGAFCVLGSHLKSKIVNLCS
jgi:4'-phosphopantetheinyl transferase